MRQVLVCTGILGGGTALVFALAAATAMLFPQGTMVSSGWNGGMMFGKGMPMPAFAEEDVLRDGDVFFEVPAMQDPAIDVPEAIP
jgi:hypothetical protein